MARKKDPIKPMFALRADFVASLENLCHECMMMLQAVEMITGDGLPDHVKIPDAIRETLKERAAGLRAALSSED